MDELLTLLERYAPGYRGRIQGAYDWRIEDLEEIFGQQLPKFYREFVSCMGMGGGPLLEHVDTYEPTEIADLYRFSSVEMPPRRFLFVFGDPSLDDEHYWLDLEARSEDGDCQVVRMPFGDDAWETHLSRHFVSLREMLFVWAMENVCLPTFPHDARYFVSSDHEEPENLPNVEEIARAFEKQGFTRLPYPRYSLLFERKDASVELYRRPDKPGFWLWVGGREQKEFRRIRAIIEDMKGVEKVER
jgi:hypothetical protein